MERETSVSRAYPVASIVSPALDRPPTAAHFDNLIDLITSTIAPNSWSSVGGVGAIDSFPPTLQLVVHQTPEVHDEIAALLRQVEKQMRVAAETGQVAAEAPSP